MTHTVLYVTAFKDIGRSEWGHMPVSNANYMERFLYLHRICPNLVVYADEAMQEMLRAHPEVDPGRVRDYREEDTFMATHLERERAAMASETFRASVMRDRPDWAQHPSVNVPEYNVVNHNKVHFLRRARDEHPQYAFYVWIDFGYLRVAADVALPDSLPHMPKDRVGLTSHMTDEMARKVTMPMDFMFFGGVCIVPSGQVDMLYDRYVEQLQRNYTEGTAMDDQLVHQRIFFRHRDLYHVICVGRFFELRFLCPCANGDV
jgi:hypothetical protein